MPWRLNTYQYFPYTASGSPSDNAMGVNTVGAS